jgi:hypothetical protein
LKSWRIGWRAPGVAIVAVGLIGAALFTVAHINWSSTADTSIPAPGPPTSASPKDFSDGLGIYFFNDGKYSFLTWRSKLYTPRTIPDEKAMLEISQRAARVASFHYFARRALKQERDVLE